MIPKEFGGEWFVMRGDDVMVGPFPCNADAWRWLDRQTGEPISPAEKKSEWIASKILGGTK